MSALHEHLGAVQLIDHHVHGCWLRPRDRAGFENALNEANTESLADFDSGFDTQLGFAVRAHCATALGLGRHAEALLRASRTGSSTPESGRGSLLLRN